MSQKTSTLQYRITKPPRKDKESNATKFIVLEPGIVQQADLLQLPNDKGFKYLLVVCDQSRKIDGQPIRSKTAFAVLNGFKKIYARKILNMPKRIEFDGGSEFKSIVEQYFKDNKVMISVGKPGRHRQQGLVERTNQILGKEIFEKQLEKELQTGKNSRLWLHLYRKIIDDMNSAKKPPTTDSENQATIAQGSAKSLLGIGQKVLAVADEPRDIEGAKLPGRFRTTDMKFYPKIRTITEVILKPGSPPLYLLDGTFGQEKVDNVAYTKNQLLILKDNEIEQLSKLPINK